MYKTFFTYIVVRGDAYFSTNSCKLRHWTSAKGLKPLIQITPSTTFLYH